MFEKARAYIEGKVKRNLLLQEHKATGKLYNSIKVVTKAELERAFIKGYMEDYSRFVENGRRAGKRPPIFVIEKWIAVKRLNLGGKTIKSVAFAIANSMAQKGIPPQGGYTYWKRGNELKRKGFINDSLSELDTELANLFYNDVYQNLEYELKNIIKRNETKAN